MSTTARGTTEVWGSWENELGWKGTTTKDSVPVYILEEKVSSAKETHQAMETADHSALCM